MNASMLRRIRPRAVWTAAAALALALVSCSKQQPTQVDPSFTTLEGARSPQAMMVLWYDMPTPLYLFRDFSPQGPDTADRLLDILYTQREVPGTIAGSIFDGTSAGQYQLFRREPNNGLRQLRDLKLRSTKQWLERQWEMYPFTDPTPSLRDPSPYIGRGVVQGSVTPRSPLTNEAQVTPLDSLYDIKLYGRDRFGNTIPIFPGYRDSSLSFTFDQVPGATRYWIQVYRFSTIPSGQLFVLSGTPAPIYSELSRDYLLGFKDVPASGDTTGPTTWIATRPLTPQVYLIRISATDSSGMLIGFSSGYDPPLPMPSPAHTGNMTLTDTSYVQFPLGAFSFDLRRRFLPGVQAQDAIHFGILPTYRAKRIHEIGRGGIRRGRALRPFTLPGSFYGRSLSPNDPRSRLGG